MPFWVLGLGWGVVVVWFAVVDAVVSKTGGDGQDGQERGKRGAMPIRLLLDPGRLVEAALLTLLAGLWFASLGHGGWFLLFPLLGAWAGWVAQQRARAPFDRAALKAFAMVVVRTTVAGGLLQWIL